MTEQPAPPRRQRIEELIFLKIPYAVSGTLFLAAALAGYGIAAGAAKPVI